MKSINNSTTSIPRWKILKISSIHVGVGVSIVSITGFVNSEMKFLGWESSLITFYFGIAILFELSRLVAGYLQDHHPRTRFYVILGTVLSLIGLILIPIFVKQINSAIFIVPIAFYYFGTAITTTIVDTHLTVISHPKERNRISGTLQSARLFGFAVGGIVGSLIYLKLDFTVFMAIITSIFLFSALYTIISLNPENIRTINFHTGQVNSNPIHSPQNESPNNESVLHSLKDHNIGLMSVFLILFAIGLFMQDLILEPFAIAELNFEKSDVGILVALWGIVTLIFVPLGSTLEPKIGKLNTISIGLIVASVGMAIITLSSTFHEEFFFYFGLVIFSAGSGLSSGPAISVMLDLCFLDSKNTSFLLGFFGMIITVGRAIAAIVSGILLKYTDDNFTIVFFIETIFLLVSLIPIIPISKRIDKWLAMGDPENLVLQGIPSLD
ncbi:MAG: MFS transporter [Candidatus Kariarchaeaceae archaeon]|jgi:predicted MFS family arabinose efflux permease